MFLQQYVNLTWSFLIAGNAKTVRNNNSSRFHKIWISIYWDISGLPLEKMFITKFLQEVSKLLFKIENKIFLTWVCWQVWKVRGDPLLVRATDRGNDFKLLAGKKQSCQPGWCEQCLKFSKMFYMIHRSIRVVDYIIDLNIRIGHLVR